MIRHLWHHRELIWQFTQREIELRHRGSHLGLVWSVLNPLLMLGLYFFVFGYIFEGHFGVIADESRVDYALGIFLGLSFFRLIAETLTTSPGLIVANPNFVKKVVFPLEVLPLAQIGSALFHTVISLVLVLIGVAWAGPGLSAGVLWLPVIVVPLVFLMTGIAWLISGLGVFVRDIGQIMQFLSMVILYASAVFYSATRIPDSIWPLLRLNPLLLALEMARNAILWHHPVNLIHLAYLYVLGTAVCVLGYRAFHRMKPAFADVL